MTSSQLLRTQTQSSRLQYAQQLSFGRGHAVKPPAEPERARGIPRPKRFHWCYLGVLVLLVMLVECTNGATGYTCPGASGTCTTSGDTPTRSSHSMGRIYLEPYVLFQNGDLVMIEGDEIYFYKIIGHFYNEHGKMFYLEPQDLLEDADIIKRSWDQITHWVLDDDDESAVLIPQELSIRWANRGTCMPLGSNLVLTKDGDSIKGRIVDHGFDQRRRLVTYTIYTTSMVCEDDLERVEKEDAIPYFAREATKGKMGQVEWRLTDPNWVWYKEEKWYIKKRHSDGQVTIYKTWTTTVPELISNYSTAQVEVPGDGFATLEPLKWPPVKPDHIYEKDPNLSRSLEELKARLNVINEELQRYKDMYKKRKHKKKFLSVIATLRTDRDKYQAAIMKLEGKDPDAETDTYTGGNCLRRR